MLKTRIITAVIGIPLLLGLLYLGGIFAKALFLVIGVLCLYEYFAMIKKKGIRPLYVPSCLLLLLLMLREQADLSEGLFFILLLMVVMMVYKFPQFSIPDLAFSLFGPVYFGYLLSFGIIRTNTENAFPFFVLCFLLTWSTDIGGYAFGKKMGKRQIDGSPKS